MSIEQQLSKQFQDDHTQLQCSPSVDARIMAEYRKHVMQKGSEQVMRRVWGLNNQSSLSKARSGRNDGSLNRVWSMKKIMMIGAIVALLCGFGYGGKLLYSYTGDKFSFNVNESERYLLSQEALEDTRAKLKGVQTQLEPGQTAIVYLPDVVSGYPIWSVAQVNYISNIEQWKQILVENQVEENVPSSLLDGEYTFEAGALSNPFKPMIGLDQFELIEEMKAESEFAAGDQVIWRITDPTTYPEMKSYTSVYKDSTGEALYLNWNILKEPIFKLEGYTSPSSEFEAYEVNDRDVHYVKNNQALLSDSGVLQSVTWIEEQENQTIIYSIETDSLSIPKALLIEAVRSLP